MKHKVLIVIYAISVLSILSSVATMLTTESNIEKAFTGIAAFIYLVIILGLWDRNEIARKIAIYYFGFQIFICLIGFVISITLIIQAEYINGLLALAVTTVFIISFVFIIRGLNNPTLLQEFNLNRVRTDD